jgi:hypothetical protein
MSERDQDREVRKYYPNLATDDPVIRRALEMHDMAKAAIEHRMEGSHER